ncbi:MAG: hemolysin family protein [Schwartzia sp. (in: firmicutes)]
MVEGIEIGIFALLALCCIGADGFCVLLETAIKESRKSRLERLADDGNHRAAQSLSIVDEPENILSMVQIGITTASILLGLTIGVWIAPMAKQHIPFLPHAYGLTLVASTLLIAYGNLLFGEFIPKKVALQDPEHILIRCIGILHLLEKISRPFVSFLSASANTVLLLWGLNPHVDDTVTEDEVKDLIEQGTEEGTFEKTEQNMVDRVFRMSDQTAYSLMTPRTQMHWLDLEDSVSYNLQLIKKYPDTVFPVGRNTLDDFCGVLYAKDLLNAAIAKKPLDIQPYIKKPLVIPRSMETFRVLERFQESGIHEAVVLDEYGGVLGFLTLSDIMAEIIDDSSPHAEPDAAQITPRDETSWHIDGLCDIDDFKEKFDLEELPNEVKDHYQTLGGFLTSYFGYLPKAGEECQWENFTFKILRMDRARIDKVLVTKIP